MFFLFFCALTSNVYILIGFRGLQGLGGGMIFGTSMAILTSVFPPQQRGRVLGLAVSAVYIGLSSGPFLGGMLTYYFGWRSLFWIISVLGLLPLIVLILKLEGEWADAADESYDVIGMLLYVPSLIAIIYGFSIVSRPAGLLMLIAGCGGLVGFVIRQRTIKEPLFQVDLFIE